MITLHNGKSYTAPELLMYWIRERYRIRTLKASGTPPPWTDDPVFQTTYFCNVHREDDKVTKFIREFYSPHVGDPMFEYNMVFARFINWPETIQTVGYMREHSPRQLEDLLNFISESGKKVWGGAYIITTHGQKMSKTKYLTEQVLTDVLDRIRHIKFMCGWNDGSTCERASVALQDIDGIGSFLAAQVVADLKNTPGHPLYNAPDKAIFVEPGPGSIRGSSWFHYGQVNKGSPSIFPERFRNIRDYVDRHWPQEVPPVDNQDLQNCLCEFDKYCRVVTGSGRSKRKYDAK